MATICQHHVQASTLGLRRKGLDEQQLYDQAAIHPLALTDRRARVHTDQVARLFKSVMLSLDDEYMGFAPNPVRVGIFATMAELVVHCRTLRELLNKAANFYGLINDDVLYALTENDGLARFNILFRSPEYDPQHFLAEFLLVIWHRFSSWFIGAPIPLTETRFAFALPNHEREVKIMFPGKQTFDCQSNALIFDCDYLDRPLIRNQQEVDLLISNAPADFMTIPGAENTIENRLVRLMSEAHETKMDNISLDWASERLNMSAQTLHRRLRDEHTSFQTVKDAHRRELALRYLLDDYRSVEEVSTLVGFQEARSFTRAFRIWTGVTPRQYRQRAKLN